MLRPPGDIPGTIPKVIAPPCNWNKQSSQVEIGEAVGKFVATEVAQIVANNPTIELIHVFSHAGDIPSK